MKIFEFIKDKSTILIFNLLIFLIFAVILLSMDTNSLIIGFLFFIWFAPLTFYMILEFINAKKYYSEIDNILDGLDKKYLLPELIKETNYIHGKKLNYILKWVSRDMHENVKYYKDIQLEYREYIETWVHEIKTPIASTKLIIENNQNEITSKIDYQVDKINEFVEQVLYYSRSNNVDRDYIIKPIELDSVVKKVIKRNYRDFIQRKIKLEIQDVDAIVYSDGKWVEFIINQIIGNSIKYSINNNPLIKIYSVKKSNSVALIIEDNGIGIADQDINRVFEKGFTGENGRRIRQSTGMGLYLCKKLCSKLGLKISISSEINKGTKVTIIFPLSEMSLLN